MSFFEKFGKGLKITESKESIIKQLLGKSDYETATEIPEVRAMSAFDLLAMHFTNDEKLRKTIMGIKDERKINSGDYILYLGYRFRINAISHQRKSRGEAVTSLKGIDDNQQAGERKKLLEGMFG